MLSHLFWLPLSAHTKLSSDIQVGETNSGLGSDRRLMRHFSLLCATEITLPTPVCGYKLNCFWTLVLFNQVVIGSGNENQTQQTRHFLKRKHFRRGTFIVTSETKIDQSHRCTYEEKVSISAN